MATTSRLPESPAAAPLLRADDLVLGYGRDPVVHGVSLEVAGPGSSVALIGESGSGKTTLARALLGLLPPIAGTVSFRGTLIAGLRGPAARAWRCGVQPVFQDGTEALNPRRRIGASVAEGLEVRGLPAHERPAAVAELLRAVGLDPDLAAARPHQLSGGQRQRVVIARALAPEPDLLVLDEPTSALDVTVQARILDLLEELRAERGVALLLITHNLALADRLCDQAYVLYAGRVVERGTTEELLSAPQHPYTQRLLAAVPRLGGTLREGPGGLAQGTPAREGCAYRPRCPRSDDDCTLQPLLVGDEVAVACHHPGPEPTA